MSAGPCPVPGGAYVPPPGQGNLFYPSSDGTYSCLNTSQYWHDIFAVPVAIGHALTDVLLLLVYGSSILLLFAALAVTICAQLPHRWLDTLRPVIVQSWGVPDDG